MADSGDELHNVASSDTFW